MTHQTLSLEMYWKLFSATLLSLIVFKLLYVHQMCPKRGIIPLIKDAFIFEIITKILNTKIDHFIIQLNTHLDCHHCHCHQQSSSSSSASHQIIWTITPICSS